MHNFSDAGISDELVSKLTDSYGQTIVDSLEININNVYKVYKSLNMMGVKKVDDLLLGRADLFLMNYEDFLNILEKKGIDNITDLLNEDLNNVNDIFFSDED